MTRKQKSKQSRTRQRQIKAAKFASCDLSFSTSAAVQLKAATEPGELKTFDITAYNGGSLSLGTFDQPVYIECSSASVHGEDDQQPILKDHDTQQIVGHGTPVIASDNLLVQGGVISHDNDASRSIIAAASNGFKWQASVGGKMTRRPVKLQAGQTRQVNGRQVAGPAYIVRGFLWRETSFCGIGCDDERASARVAASLKGALSMDFEQWLEASGFVAEDLQESQLDALKAMYEKEQELEELKESATATAVAEPEAEEQQEEEQSEERVSAAVTSPPTTNRIDPELAAAEDTKRYLARVRDARRQEDKRVADLEKLREEYAEAVPKVILAELFDSALAGDLDRNKFELEMIKAARQPRQSVISKSSYRRRKFEQNVVEAAMLRTGGMNEDSIAASIRRDVGESKTEEVMNKATERSMQGFSLHDLVFASIESAGEEMPSRRLNADVIECAMRCSQEIRATSSPTSTVSLPGTLSNIANKQMLQAYEDATGCWPQICSTADTSDYKQYDSYRLTEAGVLEPVGPSGEIKHTTLGEDAFQNRVINHARLIGLTEEMLMNDDLGAFQRLSRHFGRMSAHAIEQAVIQTLTGAPSDAGAGAATDFFRGAALDNRQPNYLTGAASALSIDSLGAAWTLFANQTDRDGKPVMLEPAVLLTTTTNAILAKNLYNSTEVRIAGTADRTREVNNPWYSMFDPVHSPYLHQAQFNAGTAQTTQWYLASRVTDDFAAIQVAFLNGQRTPQIERFDYDPNMLGVTFRAKLPFGVALQDERCIVKSDGA